MLILRTASKREKRVKERAANVNPEDFNVTRTNACPRARVHDYAFCFKPRFSKQFEQKDGHSFPTFSNRRKSTLKSLITFQF